MRLKKRLLLSASPRLLDFMAIPMPSNLGALVADMVAGQEKIWSQNGK